MIAYRTEYVNECGGIFRQKKAAVPVQDGGGKKDDSDGIGAEDRPGGGEGGDLVGGPLLGNAVEIFGVDAALQAACELNPVPDGAPADLLGRPAPEDAR